jgi:hypothetical protein
VKFDIFTIDQDSDNFVGKVLGDVDVDVANSGTRVFSHEVVLLEIPFFCESRRKRPYQDPEFYPSVIL